jgi:diguanylate cyclase (GGDEF)-like protein
MSESGLNFPVFGGGAAAYDLVSGPLILCGDRFLANGIIAVVFLGKDLHIDVISYLGWRDLSKQMEITSAHGKVVDTIDHMPAYDLYNHYLDIKGDEEFYFNALEFPLLLERNGYTLARVPFLVHEDGALEFCGELFEGETVRIGYGNPQTILAEVSSVQKEMHTFQPQAILIFTCVCRRFLLQDAVDLEMKPFENIAPTTGFFCSGEFFTTNRKLELLNSTMVVVGMRENDRQLETDFCEFPNDETVKQSTDPYTDKHSRIVTRLLHYISVQTGELGEANKGLKHLSEVDNLTQIYNRMKLDHIIAEEIGKSYRYKTVFSLILLDIDYFKSINDTFGHLAGDDALVQIAAILKETVRESDVVGRCGGEEFLLVLPLTDRDQACILAERIRGKIQAHTFAKVQHLTCSFGVTSFCEGDDKDKMLLRADKAMYRAKELGRNQVMGHKIKQF